MNIATVKPEKKVKINIAVNEYILDKIKNLAKAKDLTCSGAINFLLKEYLQNYNPVNIQETEIQKPTVKVNSAIGPKLCNQLNSIKDNFTFTMITGKAVQVIAKNL